MKPISMAQLQALAKRCEHATSKRCKCRCHGAQHGMAHSVEWMEDIVKQEQLAAFRPTERQMDFVGFKCVVLAPGLCQWCGQKPAFCMCKAGDA